MTKKSNDTIVSRNTQIIHAIAAHLTADTEIPVAGSLIKASAIVAALQQGLDGRTEVLAARSKYKEALARRVTADARALVVAEALKPWVLNRFGANSAEAHDFGYSPRKVTPPSAGTKAKAVLLSHATRLARGTLGTKVKLKIKGALVPATSAPPPPTPPATTHAPGVPTTPPAPVVAPAPAPGASAGSALNGPVHA